MSVALGICLLQCKSNKYYIFSVCVCSLRYPFVGSGKAIRIIYCECVFVALGIRLLQWKNNKYYIFSVCVCSLRYPFVSSGKAISITYSECVFVT